MYKMFAKKYVPFTFHVPIGLGNVLRIADCVSTVYVFHNTHLVTINDVTTISEKQSNNDRGNF